MCGAMKRYQCGGAAPRVLVASLSLSAAALVGLAVHEGYTERAIVPTKGDRPTVGFGSTYHADGRPVKMGDTTDPVNALKTAQAHIAKDEARFRASLPLCQAMTAPAPACAPANGWRAGDEAPRRRGRHGGVPLRYVLPPCCWPAARRSRSQCA